MTPPVPIPHRISSEHNSQPSPFQVRAWMKLPVFYLVDATCKNVYQPCSFTLTVKWTSRRAARWPRCSQRAAQVDLTVASFSVSARKSPFTVVREYPLRAYIANTLVQASPAQVSVSHRLDSTISRTKRALQARYDVNVQNTTKCCIRYVDFGPSSLVFPIYNLHSCVASLRQASLIRNWPEFSVSLAPSSFHHPPPHISRFPLRSSHLRRLFHSPTARCSRSSIKHTPKQVPVVSLNFRPRRPSRLYRLTSHSWHFVTFPVHAQVGDHLEQLHAHWRWRNLQAPDA